MRNPAEEAAEVLAAARAALGELVEEGVDRIPETAEAAKPAVESPTLEAVRAELGECIRCGLSEGRTQIVFGDGNPHADLLFIGEGPGEQEDLRGLPFVGRAGELLTRMIEKGLGIRAKRGLHLQHRQVPTAWEQDSSRQGGDRLPPLPRRSDRRSPAPGHRHAGQARVEPAARSRHRDHQGAREPGTSTAGSR